MTRLLGVTGIQNRRWRDRPNQALKNQIPAAKATSGLASFERTRAFYRKCGYDEEARIRDFYRAGDDKIVYRKALAAQGQ